jgi:hypothetical protein
MNFREYVEGLNKVLEDNPEAGEYKAIYSADDEGNQYFPVQASAEIGKFFPDDQLGEFLSQEMALEEPELYEGEDTTPDAVCIN